MVLFQIFKPWYFISNEEKYDNMRGIIGYPPIGIMDLLIICKKSYQNMSFINFLHMNCPVI